MARKLVSRSAAKKTARTTVSRIVIADASPIIGLSLIGGLDWLQPLFGSVTITSTVRDELLFNVEREPKHGMAEIVKAINQRIIKVLSRDWPEPLFAHLDDGEASVLRAAANQRVACLVIIDEALGRRAALALVNLVQMPIAVTGLVGLIIAAKQKRLIPKVAPVLKRLDDVGFRLSPVLVAEALVMAREL